MAVGSWQLAVVGCRLSVVRRRGFHGRAPLKVCHPDRGPRSERRDLLSVAVAGSRPGSEQRLSCLSALSCQHSITFGVIPTKGFSPRGGTCCPCGASQLSFGRINDNRCMEHQYYCASCHRPREADQALAAREEGRADRTRKSDVGRPCVRMGKASAVGLPRPCHRHGQQVPPLGLTSLVGMTRLRNFGL